MNVDGSPQSVEILNSGCQREVGLASVVNHVAEAAARVFTLIRGFAVVL